MVAPLSPIVPYDPQKALACSTLVDLAYSTFSNNVGNSNPPPPVFPDGWQIQFNLQLDLRLLGTLYFIGWILARNLGNGRTENAIVFLGTEDKEWLYDLDGTCVPHPLGGEVETGMYDMFCSITALVPGQSTVASTLLTKYLAQLNAANPVTITGHSLGGAFTTLTAAAISMQALPPAQQNMQVYSLASPRIGNADFANAFDAVVANNYRICNIRDYVPTLPPAEWGFQHVLTALPQPELDSWQYPIYHGLDPFKAVECYHSHNGYNYMLSILAGQIPATSELAGCFAPNIQRRSLQLTHASPD